MERYVTNAPPRFSTRPLIEPPNQVLPPKSALPLEPTLTEKAPGMRRPKPYRILRDIRSISAHHYRNAAIDNDDRLWIWGAKRPVRMEKAPNGFNRLIKDIEYVPQHVMDNVLSVCSGEDHYLCVTKDRKLWGWGENRYGELGLGDCLPRTEPTIIADGVKRAFCGSRQSFFVKEDDSLWRSGYICTPQVGDLRSHVSLPQFVMSDIKCVAVFEHSFLAVALDDTLWFWGQNNPKYFLGEKVYFHTDTPLPLLKGVCDFGRFPRMSSSIFLITPCGDMYLLGIGADDALIPYQMMMDADGRPIKVMDNTCAAAKGRYSTLALVNDGRLFAFGGNSAGECGTGKSTGIIRKPRRIMENVIAVEAGECHGLALQKNGDLWIWGGDYSLSTPEA